MIKQNLEPINIMLADNNPLILSGMSDIFDRDPRFSLVGHVRPLQRDFWAW